MNHKKKWWFWVSILGNCFKKRLRRSCFHVHFTKFIRTVFYKTPLKCCLYKSNSMLFYIFDLLSKFGESFVCFYHLLFNPFQSSVLLVYPLKMSMNQRCSDIFRGYRNRILVWDGLRRNIRCFLSFGTICTI